MPTVSVVVAAYTVDRWTLLERCMRSVIDQSVRPAEIVLCIDHNETLYDKAAAVWGTDGPIRVIRNPHPHGEAALASHRRAHGTRRRFGAGSARNAGVAQTSSDIVAIIDDDACAEPDWLARLLSGYTSDAIVAVGGAALPRFETTRPPWFPRTFDWVFGCSYQGLPAHTAPVRRLIGASMSFRRSAFDEVGGFGSIDFDDLDMSMRLGHRYGHGALLYAPAARVHHHVPAERVTWHYFWRRCLHVNTEKVEAFADMGDAASLTAEVSFALRALVFGTASEARRVLRGDPGGLVASGVIVCGLALAAVGNVLGRLRMRRSVR